MIANFRQHCFWERGELEVNCKISVYAEGLLPPGKEGEGWGGGGVCQPIVLLNVGRQYPLQK